MDPCEKDKKSVEGPPAEPVPYHSTLNAAEVMVPVVQMISPQATFAQLSETFREMWKTSYNDKANWYV